MTPVTAGLPGDKSTKTNVSMCFGLLPVIPYNLPSQDPSMQYNAIQYRMMDPTDSEYGATCHLNKNNVHFVLIHVTASTPNSQ